MASSAAAGGAGGPSPAGGSTADSAGGAWLDAWTDPVAGVKTFGQCVRLADLAGDGDYRLIVADQEKRMKVYKGTGVASVHTLLDAPVALAAFYPDSWTPRIPSIAVAAGSFVFVYRNLRPYMKFTLPQVPVAARETTLWEDFWGGKASQAALVAGLRELRGEGTPVTSRAGDVLALGEDSEVAAYLAGVRGRPLVQQTVVTCLDVINREREGDKELSSLVVGTEAKQLLLLDAGCSAIELAVNLPSVPTHLATHGTLAVEYRINVACRDGTVYAVKDRQLMATKIEVGSLPCGIVRTESLLYVGAMDGTLAGFHPKGKRQWATTLPAPITAMARATIRKAEVADCCVVALEGGQVRLYNGKSCVSTIMATDTITAIRFGQYSREANALALISRAGALAIKMTRRTASFKASEAAAGPPPEQEVPLAVPKKTRLYVEMAQREREQALEMHRIFQRDLTKLRLTAARAYVRTIADGGSALATLTGASLRLNALVSGLGPNFKIRIDITNVGSHAAMDVQLFFAFNPKRYALPRSHLKIPMLVPGIRYEYEFPAFCIDPTGAADGIRCLVLRSAATSTPAINAIINMPMSQPLPSM